MNNVATKADLQAVRAEIGQLRSELNAIFDQVDARLDLLEHRVVTRIGSLVVIVAGLLFAALHYVH